MNRFTSVIGGARLSPKVQAAIGLAIFLILMAVPYMLSSSLMFRIGAAVCAALLALSFNLLLGATGLISFAHGALFALGGYAVGIAMREGHAWPLALLAAVALGVVVGAVFSVLALRVSGVYFSIITLATGQIIYIVLLQWSEVTGGDNGLSGIAPGQVLGINLNSQVTYYWVVVVLAAVAAVALKVIRDSRFGRTLTAIREDGVRAAYLGIPVGRYRAIAFTISATFAVFAGALFGPFVGLMVPEDASLMSSSEPILATLLGGIGNFAGPIVGAGILALLEYFTRDLASLRLIIAGGLLLLVILVTPGGVTGTAANLARKLRERDGDSSPVPPEDSERSKENTASPNAGPGEMSAPSNANHDNQLTSAYDKGSRHD